MRKGYWADDQANLDSASHTVDQAGRRVIPASARPVKLNTRAHAFGSQSVSARRSQLPANNSATITLSTPWSRRIRLARVCVGMASQSTRPKHSGHQSAQDPGRDGVGRGDGEACVASDHAEYVEHHGRSKQTEGNTMSMGCTGWPNAFVRLSMAFPPAVEIFGMNQ
jgi:hypothetical protein